MVRNLEGFLQKYPESSQRSQIYRALVESTLQLRDFPRATEYAERLVAINPEDISMTVLAIQLLERHGDAAGWHRGISYCTRVVDQLDRTPLSDKSPRVSPAEWENDKRRDKSSLLLVRGRLYKKLNDISNAQKDFEASYALQPNAAAAERLGEIAEMKKDPALAIQDYARAFALTDATNGASSRAELRKKVGNVWRLAHGSEDGLGDYLLRAFDEVACAGYSQPGLERALRVYPPEGSRRRALSVCGHQGKNRSTEFLGHLVRPLPGTGAALRNIGGPLCPGQGRAVLRIELR